MNENEALAKMVTPGQRREGKMMGGVIQINITRACNLNCYNCTQGSHLGGKSDMMSLKNFEQACLSLKDYFGVVGVFGGNPAMHPQFEEICYILRKHIPFERRGLWCNNPMGKGATMRATFNPKHSNLNVHMDVNAYSEFKRDWPECNPCGLSEDSRHSPPWVAMKDVLKKECPECKGTGNSKEPQSPFWSDEPRDDCKSCNGLGSVYDQERAYELISGCDINQHWSAMIGEFRGELRAWFCEIAGAQSIVHQWDTNQKEVEASGAVCTCGADRSGPSAEAHLEDCPVKVKFTYPDTGLDPALRYLHAEDPTNSEGHDWWQSRMTLYSYQVRKHCHECGIPLRGYGELAQAKGGTEQVSATHLGVYKTKKVGRKVETVTTLEQLGIGRIRNMVRYIQNSKV